MTAITLLDGAMTALDGIRSTLGGAGKLVAEISTVYRQLFEARAECLRLQDENIALKASVRELKEAVAREDAFDREHEKYKLQEIGPRSFAYGLKEEAQGSQPPHHLCVPCFQKRRISLLQLSERLSGHDVLKCPECGAEVRATNDVEDLAMIAPVLDRRDWGGF